MSDARPVLHLMCGKIAAGKSSLSARLSKAGGTLLIAEDHWTSNLFGPEMKEVADYIRFSARLRQAMAPHIVAILRLGISVVLDFPANTRRNRAWMRGIVDESGADHCLHWLDVPDEICKARLRARNAAGEHEFSASDAEFDIITGYFEIPTEDEGLIIRRYPGGLDPAPQG